MLLYEPKSELCGRNKAIDTQLSKCYIGHLLDEDISFRYYYDKEN